MRQLRDISFLQTFGIILVVLGHSFYRIPSDNIILRWIYVFHMPLFFFISGYLLKYTHAEINSLQLKGYFTRKAKRLLLPYIIISSLLFVPKALMSKYTVRPISLDWHSYIDQLIYPYHNVLGAYWFMPTLFLIFVLFIVLVKVFGKRIIGSLPVLIIFALINIFMPFTKESLLNVVGVVYYMLYFLIGYDYKGSRIEETIKRVNGWCILAITLPISIVFLFIPYFYSYDILSAMNGIFLSIGLAKIYENSGCRFLDHLYGLTYYIYLYSGLFQILSLQVLLHFIPLPPAAYIPLGFLTGLYGPVCMFKLKKYIINKIDSQRKTCQKSTS